MKCEMNNIANNIQHICINDTVDILVVKDNDNYIVKVLEINSDKTSVEVEIIKYSEYCELLGIEE